MACVLPLKVSVALIAPVAATFTLVIVGVTPAGSPMICTVPAALIPPCGVMVSETEPEPVWIIDKDDAPSCN